MVDLFNNNETLDDNFTSPFKKKVLWISTCCTLYKTTYNKWNGTYCINLLWRTRNHGWNMHLDIVTSYNNNMYMTSIIEVASNLTSFPFKSMTCHLRGHIILKNCAKINLSAHSLCPHNFQQGVDWNWTWMQIGIGLCTNYNKAKGSNELASTSSSSYFLETIFCFMGVVTIHIVELQLGKW